MLVLIPEKHRAELPIGVWCSTTREALSRTPDQQQSGWPSM